MCKRDWIVLIAMVLTVTFFGIVGMAEWEIRTKYKPGGTSKEALEEMTARPGEPLTWKESEKRRMELARKKAGN